MTQRILELAKECGITEWYIGNDDARTARQLRHCEQLVHFYLTAYADCAKHYARKDEDLEKFHTAAYQAGEAAMRERAAKVGSSYEPRCDSCPSGIENAIRNLEIEP
jgi:hypothetical protein